VSNKMVMFCSCKLCYQELPPDQSMEQYSRLLVGATPKKTLLVRCQRHDVTVVEIKDIKQFCSSMKCGACEGGVPHTH